MPWSLRPKRSARTGGTWPRPKRGPLGLAQRALSPRGRIMSLGTRNPGAPRPVAAGLAGRCRLQPTALGLGALDPPWGPSPPCGLSFRPISFWASQPIARRFRSAHLAHAGASTARPRWGNTAKVKPDAPRQPVLFPRCRAGCQSPVLCSSAGCDPDRDLGDLRLCDAAPRPSHSHSTDCGSRLKQGLERNVLIESSGLSTAGGCLLILQRILLWKHIKDDWHGESPPLLPPPSGLSVVINPNTVRMTFV